MIAADRKLVDSNRVKYARALEAAERRLRDDSRFLGMPTMRGKIAEAGALWAFTGEHHGLGRGAYNRADTETKNLMTEGVDLARDVAIEAIEYLSEPGVMNPGFGNQGSGRP